MYMLFSKANNFQQIRLWATQKLYFIWKLVNPYFSRNKKKLSGQHGFNAPLRWVAECIQHIDPGEKARMKILMGLNFYGRYISNVESNNVEHILGRDLVKKIKNMNHETEFDWSNDAHEHYLMYNGQFFFVKFYFFF